MLGNLLDTSFTMLRLLSSFAGEAVGWWRETLFCSVGDLDARCVSGCGRPQSGVLGVNPLGDQKYRRRRTEDYSRIDIPHDMACSTHRQARELISGPDLATGGPIIVL